MSSDRLTRAAVLLLSALAVVSCASSSAPKGWLEEPDDVPTSAFGGWLEIRAGRERDSKWVEGEFLAISTRADTVYVETAHGFEAVPTALIRHARVDAFRPQTRRAVGITAGGTASTLTNGFLLVITAPLWITVGTIAASTVSREPLHGVSGQGWKDVSIYARFPQGLPPDLDRGSLQPKSRTQPHREGLIVTLDNGTVLVARKINVSTQGYVNVDLVDGTKQHFDVIHIRSVRDENGRDLTKRVVAGGETKP